MSEASILGKIIISGKLELLSPLLIGAGASQSDIDCEVVKTSKGVPYIPGTSFAGVLHDYFSVFSSGADREQVDFFWGMVGKENDIKQSAIAVSDAQLSGYQIAIRDGVTIDGLTGMAEDGKKYNYEVVEPGATAEFKLEVTLRKIYNKQSFLKIVAFLIQGLHTGDIQFGAMTAKGFGEVRLLEHKIIYFDFQKPQHILAWLAEDFAAGEVLDLLVEPTYPKGNKIFTIDAWFALKSSLIVRSYNVPASGDDAVQMESGGRGVIPGTSIKGALRARARAIGKQFGYHTDAWLNSFMGFADDEQCEKKCKSKLVVKECYFDNSTAAQQMRIRIDRFTGGVIKTALFSTKPVWCKEGQAPIINIRLVIKEYEPWEAGLLMMLVKDLWTGTLALGGEKAIGRGVLQGVRAEISDGIEEWQLEEGENGLEVAGDMRSLEGLAKAFAARLEKVGGSNA